MPKISVIVPSYNTEKYIERCINSLMNQNVNDIEILIIDDGSTDSSVKIIKNYLKKDKRIKLICQKNSGPAYARNKGLKAATGKYIMFCDSDDWYEPNMCEVMYRTIEEQNVDVVCCHNFFEYETGLSEQERIDRLQDRYYNPNRVGKFILSDQMILSTNVCLWNKIWKREIIEKFNITFPVGHEHDDDAFWYMYAMVSQSIFYLHTPLYHYFLRPGSIMSTQAQKHPKNRMDRVEVSYYILDFYHKNRKIDRDHLIPLIYFQQLKCCRPFFTALEMERLCHQANQKLINVFDDPDPLTCVEGEIFLLFKNKAILRLICEKAYYSMAFYLCYFRSSMKKIKYRRKILKNKAYFKKWRMENA